MRSLILAIALVFMPAMAFGQQIQIGVNIGVHQFYPRVHHRYSPYVRPSVVHPRVYVYPPIYIHPSPYTIPYSRGYNYYPYGSYYYRKSGTGIYFQFQVR